MCLYLWLRRNWSINTCLTYVSDFINFNFVFFSTNNIIVNSHHRDDSAEYITNSENDPKKDVPQNLSTTANNVSGGKDDNNYKHSYPMSASKTFPGDSVASDLSSKSVDLTSKFALQSDKKDLKVN